ncbi:MAG: hypothetical protein Q8M07_08310 [Prosthecobacter sp.]|nr:hypothetical protein [Prosthecobacter sp.]
MTVLTLLALAALCGWLWSCVKHASGVSSLKFQVSGLPLAMAPVSQGMIFGLLLSLSALGIVLAVRKVRENELEEEMRWEVVGMTNDELRRVQMGLEDLREIVNACRVESRVALLFVEAALTTTDMDDYADALRAAHEKLAQVTKTLGELRRSLNHGPAQAGTTNAEGAKA